MALSAKVNALGVEKTVDGKTVIGKGTLSVYGLNARFPVSFYANQWLELAAAMPTIKAMVDKAVKDGTMSLERTAKDGGNGRVLLAAYTVGK